MATRKGKKPSVVAMRRRIASDEELGADGKARNGKPLRAPRVIEFPKPLAAEDVVSETIIFEIGSDRFAIKWRAEIEQLPPAGPVLVERRKQQQNASRPPRLRR
jgi:hypothetical protein